jgi:hypothetical protein
MAKRKQDLRTGNIGMTVHRYPDIKTLRTNADIFWQIAQLQPFFPPIEKLFKTNLVENPSEFGIRFDNQLSNILAQSVIKTDSGEILSVHKKVTMLLSPFKWMQGDYGNPNGLPLTSEQSALATSKIQNSNNAAYVGAIISAALAHSGCQHFPIIYGIYSGIARNHIIDISDDYEDLCDRSWFSSNIGNTFEIKLSDAVHESTEFKHTRTSKLPLLVGDETAEIQIDTIEGIPDESKMGELNQVYRDSDEYSDDESDSSSVSTSYIYTARSCDSDVDPEEDYDDDEGIEESFAWASFTNVPVQVTVMKKYEGTFYKLMIENPDKHKQLAWLTQVIAALAFAQRNFAFTHNDLHANNIMYSKTNEELFYYSCDGTFFQVPTYGYLITIIDFERSIASIKLNGMKESKLFMSDHYDPDEEAGGQYNTGPYYTPRYKEIKANPSFDLVRLATSIFWDMFPEGPTGNYSDNIVFTFFMKWLTLEDGSSILFGKKEVKHDRFHGFHLYKAIVRLCKDAIPRKELLSLKSVFGIESLPTGVSLCSIDL